MVTNLIKDKVESFSDGKTYTDEYDDDECKEDKIIGFIQNTCG